MATETWENVSVTLESHPDGEAVHIAITKPSGAGVSIGVKPKLTLTDEDQVTATVKTTIHDIHENGEYIQRLP